MSRLVRAPALHFLVAGGVLFALHAWWRGTAPSGPRPRIVFDAAAVERLRQDWTATHGAPPDAAAERTLIAHAIDEEVLHREALAAGLDRRDPLVRARLADLGRFLADAREETGDVEREARRLGLASHDVVARRHLISALRLALSRPAAADLPDASALRAHLAAHAGHFEEPARVRLTHVYLARDRRGAARERDAGEMLAALRGARVSPDAAPARGDPFLHGAHLPAASHADLVRLFGAGFADALRDAPPGVWLGPVQSSYGLHLVWVHDRAEARLPALDTVRTRVAHRVIAERGQARLRQRLAALRAGYDVVVER